MKRCRIAVLLAFLASSAASAQPLPQSMWVKMTHTRRPAVLADSTPSFYKRKAEWQSIIDTYWGPGEPVSEKRAMFN